MNRAPPKPEQLNKVPALLPGHAMPYPCLAVSSDAAPSRKPSQSPLYPQHSVSGKKPSVLETGAPLPSPPYSQHPAQCPAHRVSSQEWLLNDDGQMDKQRKEGKQVCRWADLKKSTLVKMAVGPVAGSPVTPSQGPANSS